MVVSTDHVLTAHPRVQHALQAARTAANTHVDADVLALAERRVCELLGVEVSASLPATPSVPDGLAYAVTAFVEQWVVDVANVSAEMVEPLRTYLGEDQLMDFLHALLLVEQRIRLDVAWVRLGLVE